LLYNKVFFFRSYKSRKRLKQDENGSSEPKIVDGTKGSSEAAKDDKDKDEVTIVKSDEVVKTDENGSKSPSRPPKADSVPPIKSPAPTPMETDESPVKEEPAKADEKGSDPPKTTSA
jgi:hypothetical protein